MTTPRWIPHALRIPSNVEPERWIYLRQWVRWRPDFWDRTCRGGVIHACTVRPGGVRVRLRGLPDYTCSADAGVEELAGVVDAWLLGLGAEVVTPEAWDIACRSGATEAL